MDSVGNSSHTSDEELSCEMNDLSVEGVGCALNGGVSVEVGSCLREELLQFSEVVDFCSEGFFLQEEDDDVSVCVCVCVCVFACVFACVCVCV